MKHDFEVTIALDICCYECGDDLECEVNTHGDLRVRPCATCLRAEREDAEHEGYEEGYRDGEDNAQDKKGD